MNIILEAARFARNAHQGQFRKFSGRPYIEHPMRVAGQVSLMPGATERHVCAGWLHDVLEDTNVTYNELRYEFGGEVADLVQELTNPSKQHPELNRADRKKMDRLHLVHVSTSAKIIKLCDRIDNLRDLGWSNDFTETYCKESSLLALALDASDTSPVVHELCLKLHSEITTVCM